MDKAKVQIDIIRSSIVELTDQLANSGYLNLNTKNSNKFVEELEDILKQEEKKLQEYKYSNPECFI